MRKPDHGRFSTTGNEAESEVGTPLTDPEIKKVKAFLKSLTGEYEGERLH